MTSRSPARPEPEHAPPQRVSLLAWCRHRLETLSIANPVVKRFRLLLLSLAAIALLSVAKALVHWAGFEFLELNQLFTTAIAGAIFILGFLLRSVLSDYKDAERMPGALRVALEAIHDDVALFGDTSARTADILATRRTLHEISVTLRTAIRTDKLTEKSPELLATVDRLSLIFVKLEQLDMPANYIVRLRSNLDQVRHVLFRIIHIQRMQFLPSAHLLAQSLVLAVTALLLFLQTGGSPESAILFAVMSYMLVFVLYLIDTLENPFGDTSHSFDDVSLFLLRGFEHKLQRLIDAPPDGAQTHDAEVPKPSSTRDDT